MLSTRWEASLSISGPVAILDGTRAETMSEWMEETTMSGLAEMAILLLLAWVEAEDAVTSEVVEISEEAEAISEVEVASEVAVMETEEALASSRRVKWDDHMAMIRLMEEMASVKDTTRTSIRDRQAIGIKLRLRTMIGIRLVVDKDGEQLRK